MLFKKLLCFIVYSVIFATVTDSALIDEIKAQNEKFMKAFGDGDVRAVSELYTEDCKLMPPGTDVQIGRAAVMSVFGSLRQSGAKTVLLEISEVGPFTNISTEFVYERSHYTFNDGSGMVIDHGKYVVIWKRVQGIYNLYIDIFNTDKPQEII